MADANYSNVAVPTTLTGSISSGATSITVGATTGFPGGFPYTLALDYGSGTEELVKVTAAASLTLTVQRGFSGTSAQSHSLGAVVKHVYHAGDATDFRTHQDATSDVHGVTGALVGATSTQTLTNKTLTAPTINNAAYASGGSLAGTFTGSPTLSGTPVFSGGLTFSGTPAVSGSFSFSGTPSIGGAATFTGAPNFQGATASTVASGHQVSGDTTPRLQTRADGRLMWGPGNGAADVVLYRGEADILDTEDTLRSTRSSAVGDVLAARVTADAGYRYVVEASGAMGWGDGSSLSMDTNLYRSAADTLKTDDDLDVAGALDVTGNITGGNLTAWTSYTPTWAGLTAAGTGSSATGRYCRVGNTIIGIAQLTAGTSPSLGTGTITVTLPVTASATPTGNLGWQGTGRHNPNNGSSWTTLLPYIAPSGTAATVFGIRQTDLAWVSPGTAGNAWVAGSSMRVQFTYEV